MLYLAYLGVTLPLLVVRLRHRRTDGWPEGVDEDGRPQFRLGAWGIPLNVLAVVYQIGMAVNLLWPRAEIYDLTGGTWWLRWSALLFVGASLAVGAVYLTLKHRLHGLVELRHVSHTHVPEA
jgi:hypothetical protein